MMSICLQSMVDELMVKKSGGSIRKVSSKHRPSSCVAVLSLPFVLGVMPLLRGRGRDWDAKGGDQPLSAPHVSIPRCYAGGWGAP